MRWRGVFWAARPQWAFFPAARHRFSPTSSACRARHGGPVGLKALASSIGEDRGTLEAIHEPYLLQIGLLQRTPRGRTVTASAYRHLGLDPTGSPGGLFDGRKPE